MTSWMQERDRLMAQTLAFVQGVTGARPETGKMAPEIQASECRDSRATAAPETPASDSIESRPALTARPAERTGSFTRTVQVATAEVTTTEVTTTADEMEWESAIAVSATAILSASSTPPRAGPRVSIDNALAAPPAFIAPRQIPLTAGSEREDIIKRVEAFRARQSRISRDRETYYNETQARIQRKLGNGDDGKALP